MREDFAETLSLNEVVLVRVGSSGGDIHRYWQKRSAKRDLYEKSNSD
jgi:hypothetical protein